MRGHSANRLPLSITTGDPAGVGPQVCLQAIAASAVDDAVVVYGDARRLEALAEACGLARTRLRSIVSGNEAQLEAGQVGVVDCGAVSDATIDARSATAEGGDAQLRALRCAVDAVLAGKSRGLVTAPVSKEAIVLSGHPFVGHTEYLAQRSGLAPDDVTMLFLGPRLRVALVTTHLSVREAAEAITQERVVRSVKHLVAAVRAEEGDGYDAAVMRIVVTGVNPHAGENGLFGNEERLVIEPALVRLRESEMSAARPIQLVGPRPAEAAFREAARGDWHGVVTMLHDQATIASKLLDWGSAVNVTWGLPFVRTSVDHGVAYDAAARGTVEPEGMIAALRMAQRLTRNAS